MRSNRESVEQWCERAIVMHSLAAAEEEALAENGNVTAKRVARKHVDETAEDLAQALAALQAARRDIAG